MLSLREGSLASIFENNEEEREAEADEVRGERGRSWTQERPWKMPTAWSSWWASAAHSKHTPSLRNPSGSLRVKVYRVCLGMEMVRLL